MASLDLDPNDRLDLSGMTIEQRKKLRVANVFRHMLKVRIVRQSFSFVVYSCESFYFLNFSTGLKHAYNQLLKLL